jgi:hypothetical protein
MLNVDETEDRINRLVGTRFPHQVAEILEGLEQRDLVVVVAAALYRSKVAGEREGIKSAKDKIRSRLGL